MRKSTIMRACSALTLLAIVVLTCRDQCARADASAMESLCNAYRVALVDETQKLQASIDDDAALKQAFAAHEGERRLCQLDAAKREAMRAAEAAHVTSFLTLGPVLNAARMDDGVRTDDLSAHANGCGEALRPLEERRKELRTTMMSIFTGSDPRLRCDQGEFANAMLAGAGLLLIVLSPIIVIGAPFLVVYPRIRRSRTAGQAAADEWNATKFAFLVSLVVAVCWTAYALPVTWGDVGIILIPMIGIPLSVGAGIVAWAVAKLAPK